MLKLGIPCYRWKKNSCWFDCSLVAIVQTVGRDTESFTVRFDGMPADTTLLQLHNVVIQYRDTLAQDEAAADLLIPVALDEQRDLFRQVLLSSSSAPVIKSLGSAENVFVSAYLDITQCREY